jgi:hypothetical protein
VSQPVNLRWTFLVVASGFEGCRTAALPNIRIARRPPGWENRRWSSPAPWEETLMAAKRQVPIAWKGIATMAIEPD